jgi:flagellar biosynthesis component FlhA
MTKRRACEQENQQKLFKPKARGLINLKIGQSALQKLHSEQELPQGIEELKEAEFTRWGTIVPEINFELSTELNDDSIELEFAGVCFKRFEFNEDLDAQNVSSLVLSALVDLLKVHRKELINDTHTRTLFEIYNGVAEDLINNLVPEKSSVTTISRILRRLLAEGVGIREFPSILQAIADFIGKLPASSSAGDLDEHFEQMLSAVRSQLRRTICYPLCGENWKLSVWRLSLAVDRRLANSVLTSEPIEPQFIEFIIRSVQEKIEQNSDRKLVIICSIGSRSVMAQLITEMASKVSVLAVDELADEINLEVVGELCEQRISEEAKLAA